MTRTYVSRARPLPGSGETGLTGPPGQTLDWSDTIADANLADSVYAIGLYGPSPRDPGETIFWLVGTGFSAHYDDVIWTNGHVADAMRVAGRGRGIPP